MAQSNLPQHGAELSQSSSPYFDIQAILEEATSDDGIASFLFSKSTVDCDLNSADATNRLVGIESALTADSWVLQRYSGIVPRNEKVVAVCHKNSNDVCWASHANERMPWCFAEHPSPLASAIHRSVGIKPRNQPQSSFIVISNTWLEDGRSSFVASCYILEPIVRHEKHILILQKYAQGKYPVPNDTLQYMVAREEASCSFCLFRGFQDCQCTEPMRRRLQSTVPPQIGRDAWSVYKWCFGVYDVGIRKYTARIRDIDQQMLPPTCITQHVKCFSNTQLGNQVALQYYTNIWLSSKKVCLMSNGHSRQGQEQEQPQVEQDTKQSRDDLNMLQELDPSTWQMTPRNYQAHNSEAHSCPATLSPSLSSSVVNIDTWSPSSACAFETLHMRTAGEGPRESFESSGNATEPEVFAKYLDDVKRMRWTTNCRNRCRFCPQQFFTRKHDLKRHIKSVHLRHREHLCPLCSHTFIRRGHLEVHMQRHHNDSSRSSG